MDSLEKKLYAKYGTKSIPPDDMPGIINDALHLGVVQKFELDENVPTPVTASELMDFFYKKRRNFLTNDSWAVDSDELDNLAKNYNGSIEQSDPNIMNNVMCAYKEYLNKTRVSNTKSRKGTILIIFLAIIAAILIISYTPKPY